MTLIFVVATILLFLGIDWYRERKKTAVQLMTAPITTSPLRIPSGIFFSHNHTWLNLFPSGKVRLGVDDFVRRMTKNPTITFLKNNTDPVHKGEPILELHEGEHILVINSPIDGTILSLNSELHTNPMLMKELLFSDGWAYTIQPKKLTDVTKFFIGEETKVWFGEEFRRLRDMLAGVNSALVPATLQDGGIPCEGLLSNCDATIWNRFEQEFLEMK